MKQFECNECGQPMEIEDDTPIEAYPYIVCAMCWEIELARMDVYSLENNND